MKEFEVIFYSTANGFEPAREFLDSLNVKLRAKMAGTILILQEMGTTIREPYSKAIEDGIFELRAKVGLDISRVLYFFYIGNRIILTNGFIKKTQKTPRKEIELAKKYRADFMERMRKGEISYD